MALLTLAELKTRAGITSSDATRDAALTALIGDVDSAVKALGQQIEQATYTDAILDAPWNSKYLYLPQFPVSSVTSLYLRWGAKGDPTAFEAADLLTAYTDYRLVIDDAANARSRRGKVEIATRSFWAFQRERQLAQLTPRFADCAGAIKVTFVAGYATVPDAVKSAVHQAVMMLYAQRATGKQITSESWNNRSVGYGGPFTAASVVHQPTVWSLLRPYVPNMSVA